MKRAISAIIVFSMVFTAAICPFARSDECLGTSAETDFLLSSAEAVNDLNIRDTTCSKSADYKALRKHTNWRKIANYTLMGTGVITTLVLAEIGMHTYKKTHPSLSKLESGVEVGQDDFVMKDGDKLLVSFKNGKYREYSYITPSSYIEKATPERLRQLKTYGIYVSKKQKGVTNIYKGDEDLL